MDDFAVDTANGDNLVATLQGVPHLLNLFLLLLLRANHEEIENNEDKKDENKGGTHACALSGSARLCLLLE